MPKGKSRKSKIVEAVATWAEVFVLYRDADEDDKEFDTVVLQFQKACSTLFAAHENVARRSQPHPGATYYEVALGDKKVGKARCNRCGTELNPAGVGRHYESPACERARKVALGEEAPAEPTE